MRSSFINMTPAMKCNKFIFSYVVAAQVQCGYLIFRTKFPIKTPISILLCSREKKTKNIVFVHYTHTI